MFTITFENEVSVEIEPNIFNSILQLARIALKEHPEITKNSDKLSKNIRELESKQMS